VNSTFTANTAQGGTAGVNLGTNSSAGGNGGNGFGGAIFGLNSRLSLTNCTLAYNAANAGAGNAPGLGDGSDVYMLAYRGAITDITLRNTILANASQGASNLVNRDLSNMSANLNFVGANLVQSWNNQGGTVTGTPTIVFEPVLGPLGSGGTGPTPTLPLLKGSPAIGTGDPMDCSNAPVSGVDQRGLPRATCDIGAYQTQPEPAPDMGTDPSRGIGGGFTCAASGAKNPGSPFGLTALLIGIGALLRWRRTSLGAR
jgi:hypothetical protein